MLEDGHELGDGDRDGDGLSPSVAVAAGVMEELAADNTAYGFGDGAGDGQDAGDGFEADAYRCWAV